MLVHLLWLRVHVHYQVFIALQWSQFITTIFLFYGHFQNVLAKKKFVKMCLPSVGDGCHRRIYNYDILHTQVESSLGVVLIWWKWSGGKKQKKKTHKSMRYWIVMTNLWPAWSSFLLRDSGLSGPKMHVYLHTYSEPSASHQGRHTSDNIPCDHKQTTLSLLFKCYQIK